MKWLSFIVIAFAGNAFSEQGACFGKMEYKHLDHGIKLHATSASWDLPMGVKEADDLGMAYAVSFPASISGHSFMWADVYFGKERNNPIFETSLNVSGDDFLTGKFTTGLEDPVFYIRVYYMVDCSQIIMEQRFEP